MTGTGSETTRRGAGASAPTAPAPTARFLAGVLAASALVQTTVSLPVQALPPLGPLVTAEFGLTRAEFGLYPSAFYLGSVFATVLWGGRADRSGVRAMYVAGLLIAALATAALALAPTFPIFLLLLVLGGIGGGLAWPATSRGVIEWFAGPRLGVVMSLKQTGYAVAGSVDGLALPWIAGGVGARWALVGVAGLVALSAIPAARWHRDRPTGSPPLVRTLPRGRPAPPERLLRDPGILRVCLAAFVASGVQQVALGFLVLFLGERVGLDVVEAGGLLALLQGVGAASRIGWGVASDTLFRGRRRPALVAVSLLGITALGSLGLMTPVTPAPALALLIALLGCGTIGWNGVAFALVGELGGRERSAEAAGLALTCSNLGIIVVPPLFGLAVDQTGSYTLAFQGLALLLLLNVAVFGTLREP